MPINIKIQTFNIFLNLDICGSYIKKKIDADKVFDVMMLADNYGYEDLKTAAMDFIMKNEKIVMTNPNLKALSKELTDQILQNIVSKHVQ